MLEFVTRGHRDSGVYVLAHAEEGQTGEVILVVFEEFEVDFPVIDYVGGIERLVEEFGIQLDSKEGEADPGFACWGVTGSVAVVL